MREFNKFLNYLLVLGVLFNGGLYFYFNERIKTQVSVFSEPTPEISASATVIRTKPKVKTAAKIAPAQPEKPVEKILIDNRPFPAPLPFATAAPVVEEPNIPPDKMNEISKELVPWLIDVSKGDPNRMRELIEEAKSNPQVFLKRLPAAMQEKVMGVGAK